jgi:hypothetical protein
MKLERARWALFLVFVTCPGLLAVTVIIPFAQGLVSSDSVINVLTKVLAIYAVQLAIITGGIFGQGTLKPGAVAPGIAFWTAVVLAAIWNLALLWRFIFFAIASEDTVERLVKYVDEVSPASSFLVAGALAYFFSKPD